MKPSEAEIAGPAKIIHKDSSKRAGNKGDSQWRRGLEAFSLTAGEPHHGVQTRAVLMRRKGVWETAPSDNMRRRAPPDMLIMSWN